MPCPVLLGSHPALQSQLSSKADRQERLAETRRKLSGYPALVFPVQGGSPGRSKREQMRMGEDCLRCRESDELGGTIALLRHYCHLRRR